MYDSATKTTTICDIDFFRRNPAVNDMGRMWGSVRFMSPEEYCKGEILDEITNVFTLGQTGFSLFTDSDCDPAVFPLPPESSAVLHKAISPRREDRYASIAEFESAWLNALNGGKIP